ncbi:fatty-acyl-CoA synthase [Rhodoligotrophos appendicifer]|uniref:long-chain-fatty-acid--CoA ligase n=1 Tax=Rhodoligotrophos appendicifer TaxID=987056 RepID=UPI001185C2F1|nr:long-chain-fatty-acid--CoA ligase [Rhodoligotrophos appendicifer]
MLGLMQDWPLLIHTIMDHASRYHGTQEIVSRTVEGPVHRYTYADCAKRARALADAVNTKLGIGAGDIVATMAWNGYRHLEIWYGLMGLGAVVHTLNPRLFADQLDYIVNHAEDKYIFLELSFIAQMEALQDKLPTVKGFIIMTDRAHMPETSLRNPICYEELIAAGDNTFAWPKLDEQQACGICYTSGTTGNPKGVVYSQRSHVLHAMAICAGDALALKSTDVVMPVVPMFHANAWSLAFSVPMAGAKMVMPGAKMDGASIYELLDQEKVTVTAGVPTVWLMLLHHLEKHPELKLDHLERALIGGSACPEAMMAAFEKKYDTKVVHAWGMTEMSPIGSIGNRSGATADLDAEAWWPLQLKQGRPPFTVEMEITDDQGQVLPNDGKTFGHLVVRGAATAREYYKGEGGKILDDKGYFDTGDVATIDAYGFMQITDRAKDVIKSGGEWISSIDLENAAVGHPAVAEAAVIGITHPKWDERPLLVLVKKPGAEVSKEEVLGFLKDKVVKWWLPDDVVFVEEIPHTATGKISKLTLRQQFAGYVLPGAEAAE